MTWSQEISELITSVDQLTSAANVKKSDLNTSVASTESDKNAAEASIVSATASFASAGANSTQAEAHKNAALAIYGTNAAQQTAVASAQASAALASGYAASGSAALQQDLSGIVTTLHRSPNTINSMMIYDTSKDSDGGAWTEKCQNTSWYNETIYGKWLGPQISEFDARYEGSTVGAELVTNGTFNTDTSGWTAGQSGILSNSNGTLIVTNSGGNFGQANQTLTISTGKLVRISFTAVATSGAQIRIFLGSTSVSQATTIGSFVFYVVVPSDNPTLIARIGNTTAGATIAVDNISVREVISSNTRSGDYFQLTTDGKFYRVWKNLLKFSDQVDNALWQKRGVTITPNDVAGPFAGTFGDSIYVATNFATPRDIRQSVNLVAGVTYCFSAYVKAGTQNLIAIGSGNFNNFSAFVNLSTQVFSSVTANTTSQVVSVGDGWYRLSISFVANTTVLSDMSITIAGQDADADPTDFISVYGAQLEYESTPTTYETKTIDGTTTEVFRGNKRDFPRLAGIVAEATSVSIYDLTEPGRPMWMRFASSGARTGIIGWTNSGSTMTSLAALNAQLMLGNSASGSLVNFASDSYNPVISSAFQINGISRLSERNNVITYTGASGVTNPQTIIVGGQNIFSAAMTVLPDAPTDPITGLRVPTIALGTNNGASIIKHNGTVVNSVATYFQSITLSPSVLTGSRGFSNADQYIAFNPGSLAAGFAFVTSYGDQFDNLGSTSRMTSRGRSQFFKSNSNRIGLRWLNESMGIVGKHLSSIITPTYNTGWMHGDIRRAYLSDTEVGSVTGSELVTNGTFDTDLSGWTASATWIWSSNGGGTAISTGTFGSLFQTIGARNSTKRVSFSYVRTTARAQLSLIDSTGVNPTISLGGTPDIAILNGNALSGTVTGIIPAGYDRISFVTTDVAAIWAIDNVSVKEVVTDRSYRAQAASINGTLTRSQLASGTSLVGYSGWSAANYLREPYSANLDFSTGEWHTSAWLNIPVTLPLDTFPVIGSAVTVPGWTNLNSSWDTFSTTGESFTASKDIASANDIAISTNTIPVILGNWYRVIINVSASTVFAYSVSLTSSTNSRSTQAATAGTGTKVLYINANVASGNFTVAVISSTIGSITVDSVSIQEIGPVLVFDRNHTSGPRICMGINGGGNIRAEAFDGTTTRTVTTTAAYNTGQWLKAEANYTTDGSLAIQVNGREVAVTRGTPLVSLTTGKNLLTYSESFDNSVWGKYIMGVTANVAIAPDGTTTADLIYPTASNTDNSLYRGGFPTAQKTHSVYAKAVGKNWLVILRENTQGGAAWFNLASGNVGTTASGYTGATITPIGSDGWYRCSVTSTSGFNQYIAFGAVDADNTTTVVASGTNGIYLWGAQLESTSSVTSYAATNVAPLTIGNSYTLDAPFPGSIALLKLGTTVPTTEQSNFMYEQEKQLFRANAISVLPDTGSIVGISYDDTTDRWSTVTAANESYWNGLVRTSAIPVPAGSYSSIVTTSGIELAARTTTNPGVDVSIPAYVLREELVKRSETANKLNRQIAVYDYIGGFTGNITSGSTAIASVTNLTYPVSPVGARISGTGIPANTVITAVSGNIIYISAAATSTTSALTISFLDFELPVGFETESVTLAGVVKQEGATKDYTRLFDGFVEMIRFAVAPGATTWVRIQASKSIQ